MRCNPGRRLRKESPGSGSLAQTNLNTIVGPIKYNKENYSRTPMVGGQWVKGKKWPWELEIVENNQYPDIKKTASLMFPIPKP
jgi:branched-chain amino acid transport system substrate-binding protein